MEIIYFLSGVGAVLLFLSVVFVSGLASRISELEKEVKNLIHCVDATNQEISTRDQEVHRRIDQEIDRVDQIYKECISHTDSRVDKLDAKFCSDGRALTEKSREFLKG